MKTVLPVRLDNGIEILGSNKVLITMGINNINITGSKITFEKTNGRDGDGDTVSNIVGFDGTELLKKCPKCTKVKRSTDFGLSGRQMPNERRDQSQCTDCRSGY